MQTPGLWVWYGRRLGRAGVWYSLSKPGISVAELAAREDSEVRGGLASGLISHLGPEAQPSPSTAVRSGEAEMEVLAQSWELQKPPEMMKHFWIQL